MEMKISGKVSKILEYARDEAMRTGSYAICVDHLMLGIIRDGDNDATLALSDLEIKIEDLKRHIDSEILCENSVPFDHSDRLGVSRGAQSVINISGLEMLKEGAAEIEPRHLLLAISKTTGNATRAFFERTGISREILSSWFSSHKENAREPLAKKTEPRPIQFTQLIQIHSGESKIFS